MTNSNQNEDRSSQDQHLSLDVDAHPVDPAPYGADTARHLIDDALEEAYQAELKEHAGSADIVSALRDRQRLAAGGAVLEERLAQHNAESPVLSGGDVDAAWDQANDAGAETVGGTAPTAGQNDIDAMGEAVGLTLGPAEPLNLSERRRRKDEERWELNPNSAEQDD